MYSPYGEVPNELPEYDALNKNSNVIQFSNIKKKNHLEILASGFDFELNTFMTKNVEIVE